MAENITANELSAKKITSQEVTVNGTNITEYLKKKVSELEIDPLFTNWLSNNSQLSDIGRNEISNYVKISDISAKYISRDELIPVTSAMCNYTYFYAIDLSVVFSTLYKICKTINNLEK